MKEIKTLKNKRIFITGGAGYLGTNLVKKFYNDNELTVFSRDEAKHYFLKKRFPKINFVIGDVRNYESLRKASLDHDVGIFAASLKQIEAVDENVNEAHEIIINGGLNSRRIAEENIKESACFVSTDKSRAATTLYGAMKFVAGESFIVNAEKLPIKLSAAIYGNVMNSTGSLIPLIWDAIDKDYELTLYSESMTRFMLPIERAVSLIEFALTKTGYNVIPKAKSFLIKDVFEIYKEEFGLKYKLGNPRISEKIHELMISEEEIPRVSSEDDYYLMHYKKVGNNEKFENNEFSSRDYTLSTEECWSFLKKYNFYKK